MRQDIAYLAFNRGIVSRLGLARADIKRIAMAAQVMTNYVCRVLGSMMLRPGWGYKGDTAGDNPARFFPFVFSASDKALIELTNQLMRIWVNDALLSRVAVASVIVDGTFVSNGSFNAAWTNSDQAGAASAWLSAGRVTFTGTGTNAAIRRQAVVVASPGVEHALRIVVERGQITIRVGSTALGDEYINQTSLGLGTHSLAFTPVAGSFYIEFNSRLLPLVIINQCTIEAAGVMTLPTPWVTADLGKIRKEQSADVCYYACNLTYQQRKTERRNAGRSWSIVLYQPQDGPFRIGNVSTTTLAPANISGTSTLAASNPTFYSTHVGALFAITSVGQDVKKNMGALNDATASIKVTGVGATRAIAIILTGLSGTGNTVILQRSYDNATWAAVAGNSWTTDQAINFNDTLDNQIVYYRLLCSVYAAGLTAAELSIGTGSARGVCRVTGFTSNILVSIDILIPFGGTAASAIWSEGSWSDFRGWPSAVKLFDGRLWWFGKSMAFGSVSDGFESYDQTVVGDSGPIIRTIGSGAVDAVNYALALQRLVIGTASAESTVRSTALEEPLTPTNFNVKQPTRQGSSANVDAVEIDATGVFVQRGGIRIYELTYDIYKYEYSVVQLSELAPLIGSPGIVRIAIQRQPDTRLHFVRSDGTVAMLVFDKTENVAAWMLQNSPAAGGLVEDAVVLPGDEGDAEDHVYYVVNRTINGVVKRYLERWATEEQARGAAPLCMLADSYISYTGGLATVITGLGTMEGQQVAVWADGADVGTIDNADGTKSYIYTVAGGQITLAAAAANVVVGLPYVAQWQSAKLTQIQSQLGPSLLNQELIEGLGIIGADLHPKGIQFGSDFAFMDDLPSVEGGYPIDQNAVRLNYDESPIIFPGKWSNDARLCLQSRSPRPATLLAAVCTVAANE